MENILDLERFPLDNPGTRDWESLVERCRKDLAEHGMFNLEGLLLPEAVTRILNEIMPVMDRSSFTHRRSHNIYFKNEVSGLAPDHPALRLFKTENDTICADQISRSALVQLYRWPHLRSFLAATMEKPALHVMDDDLACLNVMRYKEGSTLNWHFDRSEFTTSLLLQAPIEGGLFQYRTNLRSDNDPNYDGVARLLAGKDPEVEELAVQPGTLNVFRGKNTAHRVTPVSGPKDRVIAVFSYYEMPGVRFSEEERLGFYGRA
ncbi:MAG: hypothetical protein R3245_08360 [Kiloniellales bacterium]|nr:hypothetical protein [Kiloniellales bacterium]